jgi:hypothetical protein
MAWKGFGRKWQSPNRSTFPEFAWRDWEKNNEKSQTQQPVPQPRFEPSTSRMSVQSVTAMPGSNRCTESLKEIQYKGKNLLKGCIAM